MKLSGNILFKWFTVGFAFAFLFSLVYLLIEGPPFLFVPLWVQIAGYPGIELGWWFYEHLYSGHDIPAEAVGCVVNGLSYGVLFLLVGLLVRKFFKKD